MSSRIEVRDCHEPLTLYGWVPYLGGGFPGRSARYVLRGPIFSQSFETITVEYGEMAENGKRWLALKIAGSDVEKIKRIPGWKPNTGAEL